MVEVGAVARRRGPEEPDQVVQRHHRPVGAADLEGAVAEHVEAAARRDLDLPRRPLAVRDEADCGPFALQPLDPGRRPSRGREQQRRRMSRAGELERARGRLVDAVPDREVQIVVALHLVDGVERGEHLRRIAEIDVRQRAGPQRVEGADREQRGADAVAAHVEQIDREVLRVDPVIAEGIPAEPGRRDEAPVGRERRGHRRGEDRADIGGGLRELGLEPLVGRGLRRPRPLDLRLRGPQRGVGRLQAAIQLFLLLLQQRHLVRLLLHAPRVVPLGGDVDQHDPHVVAVGVELEVGRVAARELHRADEERRLGQRQEALDEDRLLVGGLPQPQPLEAVVGEVAAGADQLQIAVDVEIRERALGVHDRVQRLRDAAGHLQHAASPGQANRQLAEGVLDALARLRARQADRPAAAPQLVELGLRHRPLRDEIGLVHQQRERQRPELGLDARAERSRHLEAGGARAVGDQQVAGAASQVGRPHGRHLVLAGDVPQDQRDLPPLQLDRLLVDLDADGRQVGLGEHALDVALHQARLADGERAEHAEFLLEHDRQGDIPCRVGSFIDRDRERHPAVDRAVGIGGLLLQRLEGARPAHREQRGVHAPLLQVGPHRLRARHAERQVEHAPAGRVRMPDEDDAARDPQLRRQLDQLVQLCRERRRRPCPDRPRAARRCSRTGSSGTGSRRAAGRARRRSGPAPGKSRRRAIRAASPRPGCEPAAARRTRPNRWRRWHRSRRRR